ncbi:ATP-binding cassette domain-containing protein (plasmid) [Bradyrhizobium japonicum USDA 123]|nr:ATP-binding cassette domain-containing protein [Bradyrhizobium japonicum USDA 123]
MYAAVKSLFVRKWTMVEAVRELNFSIGQGEVVGFLGPNGAGKTTTIKMLSGLLYPSGGRTEVLGCDPWRREEHFLKQITLVMGRRNQLIWDIPAIESFEFFKLIYGIEPAQYKKTLDELTDLMEIGSLLHKPVRVLSLGERMRCELVAALLHRPKVLFLDEPTIGLDVVAQARFRSYIQAYNTRFDATIMLTSHYMQDVEALCKRVIFIDKGEVLFDGDLAALAERFAPYKSIEVFIDGNVDKLASFGEIVAQSPGRAVLRVGKNETAAVASRLLHELEVKDINITEPPISDVVRQMFRSEAAQEMVARE